MSLNMMLWCGVASSLVLGIALYPLVARTASALGVVDRPDGRRKLHGRVVPLAGGSLVVTTLLVLFGVWYAVDATFAGVLDTINLSLPKLLLAVLVMFGVGLADDRFGLRGRVKLAGQIVAISIAIAAGVRIDSITVLGLHVDFGPLGVLFTMLWLLGVTNAVNLLDGIDGMVGSIAFVIAATLAVMAAWAGKPGPALLAACLAGALAAFLVFNKPPARIFMGDSGSLTLGLLLGCLAVMASLKGPATVMFAFPVTLLFLPLLDTAAAITRRVLTGRSIYMTDRGHLHHRLLQAGLSHQRVLLLVAAFSLLLSLGVLGSIAVQSDLLAVASVTVVGGVLVTSRLFGHQELALLRRRLQDILARTGLLPVARSARLIAVRLQGRALGWDVLWQHMATRAEQLGLHTASLDINAPIFQEAYYVRWSRPIADGESPDPAGDRWHIELPLHLNGQAIGTAKFSGRSGEREVGLVFGQVHGLLEELTRLTETVLIPVMPARETVVTASLETAVTPALLLADASDKGERVGV